MTPSFPQRGTDAHRLLAAMLQAVDATVWHPNSRLNITAHSRASDLRKLGWDVSSVNMPAARKGLKKPYGYALNDPTQIAYGRRTIGVAA